VTDHAEIDLDRGGLHVANAFDRGMDALQVVEHVAEVFLHSSAELRNPAAAQLSDRLHQRLVPIDDSVHQRVEDERRAVLEQMRFPFAARAYALEAVLAVRAYRQDIRSARSSIIAGRAADLRQSRAAATAYVLWLSSTWRIFPANIRTFAKSGS
jgi:hypothetical protein